MTQKVIDDIATLTTPVLMMQAIDDNFDEVYSDIDTLENAAASNNVKDFGALGDGSTDDTAAFVSAGKGAYVPAGDFIVTGLNPKDYIGVGSIRESGEIRQYVGQDDITKKKLMYEFDFSWPGYDGILTTYGWTFCYPQAITIFENRLYIECGGNNGTVATGNYVVVRDASTGAFIYGFHPASSYFGEGVVVKRDASNNLYLYTRGSSNIDRYDITTQPTNEATVAVDASYDVNLNSFFMYDELNDQYIIQQKKGSAFNEFTRNEFGVFDNAFNKIGSFKLDINDMPNLDGEYYEESIKAQGMSIYNGGYVASYGTAYTPASHTVTGHRLLGVSLFSNDGTKLDSIFIDPDAFIEVMETLSLTGTITNTETEGTCTYNGCLYGLYVTHAHAAEAGGGVVILQELVGDLDFSGATSNLALSYKGQKNEVLHSDLGISNPMTGADFTDLQGIFEYMRGTGLRELSVYTTGSTIADYNSKTFESGLLLRITSGNYYTFTVEVISSVDTYTNYSLFCYGTLSTASMTQVRRNTSSEHTKYGTSDMINPITSVTYRDLQAICAYMAASETSTYTFKSGSSETLYTTATSTDLVPNDVVVTIKTGDYNVFNVRYESNVIDYRFTMTGTPSSTTDMVITLPVASIGPVDSPLDGTTNRAILGYEGYGKIAISRASTTTLAQIEFRNPNGLVGSISCSGSATTFNTTSDERLKTLYGKGSGRLDKLAEIIEAGAVQMAEYNGEGDSDTPHDMMIAQRLYEYMPECVTVGNEEEVGSLHFRPWTVSESTMVPFLAAALNELLERVKILEGKKSTKN